MYHERRERKSRLSFWIPLSDYDDLARRKYKKDVDSLKPDLASYNKQRAVASGNSLASTSSSTGMSVIQQTASDNLYRDMNSLVYADHRPTEEAIDRVVGKLNLEYVSLASRP